MRQLRLFVSILVLITACTTAGAQLVKFSVGVEGGGLGTYMKTEPKLYPGFEYGGFGGANVEVRIGRIAGAYVKANYSYQTSKQTLTTADGYDSGLSVKLSRQYIHIPFGVQVWMGNVAAFQLGFQQSILAGSSYTENPDGGNSLELNPDEGALKYYVSLAAGFKFNLGRIVYLNVEGTYGLSPAYVVMNNGTPVITASVGVGFRVYTYRKSAFK